jgi:hypothetical protein
LLLAAALAATLRAMNRALAPLSLVVWAVLATPGVAHAAEDEWQLTGGPAYAVMDLGGQTAHGGGVAADIAYGLTDSFALHATAALSIHSLASQPKAKPPVVGGTLAAVAGLVGLRYAFDVLKTVPYADVGIGVLTTQGPASASQVDLTYEAALGFDRLLNRTWAWGAKIAYHGYVRDYSKLPVYLYVGPTVSARWE